MNDETDSEPVRQERQRTATAERVIAQLVKILEAEREHPPVVEWRTEPCEEAQLQPMLPAPEPAPEQPVQPELPNRLDLEVVDGVVKAVWPTKPDPAVGRPRKTPTPLLSLVEMPAAPPAPPAPPMCSTLDWNAMWLRLSLWPMVSPLLRANVGPDDEVAIWRTLSAAGFSPAIIRCYLPQVLADLRQRLEGAA